MYQENVLICSLSVSGDINDIKIIDSGLEFKIGDDFIILRDHHSQDCCEAVYAYWRYLFDDIERLSNRGPYIGLEIKGVPEMGLLLVFERTSIISEKLFVPCYDIQNGYYSNELTLEVNLNNNIEYYDIASYEEERLI